ncbi:MAG: hypothetical protein AAFP69_24090, partial [Planctomycetota bacterium]
MAMVLLISLALFHHKSYRLQAIWRGYRRWSGTCLVLLASMAVICGYFSITRKEGTTDDWHLVDAIHFLRLDGDADGSGTLASVATASANRSSEQKRRRAASFTI